MKRQAPATARNREPIAAVLREELPAQGDVLEIAAGSGEHAAFFSALFPSLIWWPTDPDADAIQSIRAWRDEAQRDGEGRNLMPPQRLDAAAHAWPVDRCNAILCVNMVHISPWEATIGLMRGAGRLLEQGAPLILYGPYRRAGVDTAASNEAFDSSLKTRNPAWGLRTVEQVQSEAAANGLSLARIVDMPANNLSLVFRRR